ncbi:hypothetical protein SAMN05421736_101138 [Evansella caseinilytica]|uniref:Uncharacterized protein n=1 Tax=Evansella caseinilytica TaxID=1503961 RepID=A0A1H3GDD1_9BACI|nr:hypothetical protein SAMN05421736_101138 [Evansella caseinilytica]
MALYLTFSLLIQFFENDPVDGDSLWYQEKPICELGEKVCKKAFLLFERVQKVRETEPANLIVALPCPSAVHVRSVYAPLLMAVAPLLDLLVSVNLPC